MMTDRDECLMMMRAEVCQVLNLSSFVTVTNCVRAATDAIVAIVYANYRFYANFCVNDFQELKSSRIEYVHCHLSTQIASIHAMP